MQVNYIIIFVQVKGNVVRRSVNILQMILFVEMQQIVQKNQHVCNSYMILEEIPQFVRLQLINLQQPYVIMLQVYAMME